MSWNGAGVFNRLYNWVSDKNASINITASRVDADTNDITANGLGNCITRDGQGQPTANLPMANFRHTTVGDGVARSNYPSMGQVQDGKINWVAAAGTGDAIVATYVPALTALVDGQFCFVRAGAANTITTPTFAPNGLTAHPITKIGGTALLVGDIFGANHELILRYNLANTRWELYNPAGSTFNAATFNGLATFNAGATLVSTDAGAGVGPVLNLFRDSASPAVADLIGIIGFLGRDSAANSQSYAQIFATITDPTSTSEDAALFLQAVVAGVMTTVLQSNGPDIVIPGALAVTGAVSGAGITASAALSGATAAGAMVAAQSDQEAGSATNLLVTPGRQQFHPSAAKWWLKSIVTTGTPAQTASYNVTSITDTATGRLTVTIGTDFSSADWVFSLSVDGGGNGRPLDVQSQAAGSIELQCFTTAPALVDPSSWSAHGFGDQ